MAREQNQDNQLNKEKSSLVYEEALAAISKKVDEKLSQMAERSYEEEMEQRLEEIKEQRRREKEEWERQRQTGRRKDKKERRQGRSFLKQGRRVTEQPVESAPEAFAASLSDEPVIPVLDETTPILEQAEPEPEPEQTELKPEIAESEATPQQEEFEPVPDQSEPMSEKESFSFLKLVKRGLIAAAQITKALHLTRKDMKGEAHLTHEKRMARYHTVWAEHLKPFTEKCALVWNWLLIKGAQILVWLEEKKEKCMLRLSLFEAKARTQFEKISAKAGKILDYAEHHKLRIFGGFLAVVSCICVAAVVISNMVAYEYMYNGRVLGIVRDQDLVYKTIDVIGDKLAKSLEADVTIDKEEDITFHKIIGWNLKIDSKDDVLNSITYMRSLKAKGYAIMVDDKQEAVLQSREAAQSILDDFKNRFSQAREGVEYESIAFAENVRVAEIDTELGELENPDEVMTYLLTGAVEKKVHVVQKGQTFNAIAESYGLTPAELQSSNPGVDPGRLKIQQQLVLTQDAPVLTIQTKEISTYTAEIPFETTYENTANKYKGEKSVKQKGQNGQREVVAEIVRNNGVEVSRTELSSKVLKEPITQITLVGTKDKPKTVATGKFSYPVRGARLSSKFGRRWGRMHQGIDLAIAKGTTISAADGGTVTFAGYKGSYGYLVIINHGNGKETYYAHCSKLLVSRGTKVYKGQAIAKVGSTGRSTGPHLHFEVHVNGTPRNPLNYL